MQGAYDIVVKYPGSVSQTVRVLSGVIGNNHGDIYYGYFISDIAAAVTDVTKYDLEQDLLMSNSLDLTPRVLLNKKEIKYLEQNTKHQAGFTIIPVKVYINEKGFAKMDIALAKGKKEYDKRNTYKDKEDRREMDRAIKRYS
jgi:tmRNA-binding protein